MFALTITLAHTVTYGELLVGVGTFSLAALTGALAYQTKRSARAAQAAVEASDMPYVIATPTPVDLLPVVRAGVIPPLEIHRWEHRTVGWVLRCRLWNIGSGPAIVHEVQLRSHDEELVDGLPGHVPVAAGQARDVMIPSPRWPRTPRTGQLRIEYTHSNGKRYATMSDVTIYGDLLTCLTYPRAP